MAPVLIAWLFMCFLNFFSSSPKSDPNDKPLSVAFCLILLAGSWLFVFSFFPAVWNLGAPQWMAR